MPQVPAIKQVLALTIALVCLLHTAVGYSQTQFLVLKNGQEIEGIINQDSKQTVIQTASGSKLIFANHKVDFVSPTLAAAYWQKVARVGPTDATGHIELFHWCLDRSMLEQAGNQIKLLMEMDVSAIKLEFLFEKLTKQRQLALNPPALKPKMGESVESSSKIRQVTFEKATGPSMPSAAEVESSAAGLSPDSIRFYKRKIEPLLIRSCYTAGCHDTKSNMMPLRHLPGNQLVPKRMSQANLHEILKHIDSRRPFKNPFFAAATEAHADIDKPIIRRGSKQFENLRQWLVMISNQPFDFHSATPPLDLAAPKPSSENRLDQPQSPNFDSPPNIPALKSHPPKPSLQKDPFDPEVFNRKFGSSPPGKK